jgi:phosphatidylglycerol---prolipoprotein diacylglyceryl transferase
VPLIAATPETAHAVHAAFEGAAMALGALAYRRVRRRAGAPPTLSGPGFWILLGCLLGAGIGNKLVFWLEQPHLLAQADGWRLVLAGQSMVGGLLGGLLGTEAAKRLTGVGTSTGDLFVGPVLLGLAVGRVGCFLAGLHDGTHGLPTTLPWGVDLGDGIPRHPVQLYELAWAGATAAALLAPRTVAWAAPVPGLRFKLLLAGYLVWRLLVDALKPVPWPWPLGLSGIQWTCLVALALYAPVVSRAVRSLRHVTPEPALPVP